jgi:hypothetical protein
MGLTGCASHYEYHHQDLGERSSLVTSFAAFSVDVRVLNWGFGGGRFSKEWSDNVQSSLQRAIVKHFGGDPRFTVGEVNLQNEAAQRELEQVRNGMQDLFPERDEKVSCLPGPTPSLADAAGTDALLLVVASDRITTVGYRATLIALGVVLVPIVTGTVPACACRCRNDSHRPGASPRRAQSVGAVMPWSPIGSVRIHCAAGSCAKKSSIASR